jgi:uncharacterized protein YdeI (YjbR/CyaY-like superfamily)
MPKSKTDGTGTTKKNATTTKAKTVGKGIDTEARLFKNPSAWAAWLEKNHRTSAGIWLRLAKKNSGLMSVTYAEALETALCCGWIDGHKRPESEQAWLQKFCPRSAKSIWSKINREKALALIEAGRMTHAGHEAIEQAKSNGRWDSAYDSPSRATVPHDFQAALDGSPGANAFFTKLDRTNRYAILFRIQTAKKPETRARNVQRFIGMLERKEKIHP